MNYAATKYFMDEIVYRTHFNPKDAVMQCLTSSCLDCVAWMKVKGNGLGFSNTESIMSALAQADSAQQSLWLGSSQAALNR
eukprot:5264332-Amphidinium_carterae.1